MQGVCAHNDQPDERLEKPRSSPGKSRNPRKRLRSAAVPRLARGVTPPPSPRATGNRRGSDVDMMKRGLCVSLNPLVYFSTGAPHSGLSLNLPLNAGRLAAISSMLWSTDFADLRRLETGKNLGNLRYLRMCVSGYSRRQRLMRWLLRLPNLTRGGLDPGHGIARIHNTRRPRRQFGVIHTRMIGGDQDQIESGDGFTIPSHGFHAGPMRMFAGGADDRHMRIIIGDSARVA